MPAPTDVITAGQDGLAAAIRAAASRPNPEVTTLVADLAHVVEELTRVLEEETAALSVKDMDRMRALQADKQRLGRGYEQLYALLGRQDQAAVRAAPDFGRLGAAAPRFAEAVKENLRRIGAARSLNERILGAVRSAIVRAQAPATVYGANGRACTAGRAGTIRAGAISVNTSI
ncbi:hypothetical protein P7L74_12970 [Tistrella mobilis]|jgi:flagellar biosynthesis/type III secretory pathway chaperone|uniref:hypothetical protein n=1 Tax=Tistrella mobilis TaxID=171437 RepID=UPI0035574C8D